MEINRGDVFYVNRSETIGSEQRSGRPAIIVSNPECNEHSPVVEVVYLTCQYKKPMPTHVRIESIGRRSTALCEQITSVDVSRLGDYSLICSGKGNEDWNCSAPHGAGRLMSRKAAFNALSMEEFQKEMEGIYTTCVVPDTLDESPMAYKSMEEIVAQIGPTAEIIERIRPVYNFKAAD